jgi:hypothetical protein
MVDLPYSKHSDLSFESYQVDSKIHQHLECLKVAKSIFDSDFQQKVTSILDYASSRNGESQRLIQELAFALSSGDMIVYETAQPSRVKQSE